MVCGKPLYFFQNHSGFTALPLSFRCMYLQCTWYISFALLAIVISVIEQVKFLEMYPATKPWQSTFPQSADHISDVLRTRTHVLLMCFSCYAVTFLLYLLECALAYPLGMIFCFFPLKYRQSQKYCFRQSPDSFIEYLTQNVIVHIKSHVTRHPKFLKFSHF